MRICKAEKVEAEPKIVEQISDMSDGDLRRSLNYLQVAAMGSKAGKLNAAAFEKIAPQNDAPLVQEMLKTALKGEFIKSREILYDLMGKRGMSGKEILRTSNREIGRMQELDDRKKVEVIRLLGEYEFRLSQGANEDIQLSAMLAQLNLLGSK